MVREYFLGWIDYIIFNWLATRGRLKMFERLKELAGKLKQEIKVYQLVLNDKRTPLLPKLILALAIGYFLMPFDLIPDFIPVLGHLDDLIIVPALIFIALRLIPDEIVVDCRKKASTGK